MSNTITLQISIVPIPETKDKAQITMSIQSEEPPTYNVIINTLITLVDDLITQSTQLHEQNSIQLEESKTPA